MPAFSPAIAASVDPEVLLMVERDRRDGRRPPGRSTLVASRRPPRPTSITATSTPARRNSSKATAVVDFEERRVPPAARRRPAAPRSPSRTSASGRDASRSTSTALPSMTNRSVEIDEVRRRVARRAVAGRAQRRVDHRRDRALAVGAGDVHGSKRPLGMPEPRRRSRGCCRGRT